MVEESSLAWRNQVTGKYSGEAEEKWRRGEEGAEGFEFQTGIQSDGRIRRISVDRCLEVVSSTSVFSRVIVNLVSPTEVKREFDE